MMREAPTMGTKAAVRYWAQRTRESLRDAEAAVKRGDYGYADDVAMQASGEAAEFSEAVRALND
jgi:hypothetical protein